MKLAVRDLEKVSFFLAADSCSERCVFGRAHNSRGELRNEAGAHFLDCSGVGADFQRVGAPKRGGRK